MVTVKIFHFDVSLWCIWKLVGNKSNRPCKNFPHIHDEFLDLLISAPFPLKNLFQLNPWTGTRHTSCPKVISLSRLMRSKVTSEPYSLYSFWKLQSDISQNFFVQILLWCSSRGCLNLGQTLWHPCIYWTIVYGPRVDLSKNWHELLLLKKTWKVADKDVLCHPSLDFKFVLGKLGVCLPANVAVCKVRYPHKLFLNTFSSVCCRLVLPFYDFTVQRLDITLHVVEICWLCSTSWQEKDVLAYVTGKDL